MDADGDPIIVWSLFTRHFVSVGLSAQIIGKCLCTSLLIIPPVIGPHVQQGLVYASRIMHRVIKLAKLPRIN